jgi:hypothetical protein
MTDLDYLEFLKKDIVFAKFSNYVTEIYRYVVTMIVNIMPWYGIEQNQMKIVIIRSISSSLSI